MTNPNLARDRSTTEPEVGTLDISPAIAAELLLKRRRIRRSLIEWCRQCGYEPAPHHRLLIDRLERVARGEIKRLAVFMPPGSAKSTYGSILFPPYVMANAPNRAILAASHTTELAEKWGRRIRNLIAAHSATLGVRLSDDSHAAGRWELDNGGGARSRADQIAEPQSKNAMLRIAHDYEVLAERAEARASGHSLKSD